MIRYALLEVQLHGLNENTVTALEHWGADVSAFWIWFPAVVAFGVLAAWLYWKGIM